jgi:hypothetical protein
VDHPFGRHLAGRGCHRFAQPYRPALLALGLDRRPPGARDRTGDAAAVLKGRVGGVGDRVDLELRYVRLLDLDGCHLTSRLLTGDSGVCRARGHEHN